MVLTSGNVGVYLCEFTMLKIMMKYVVCLVMTVTTGVTSSFAQESGWFPITENEIWARTGFFFGDTLGYVFGGDYNGNGYMYKTEDQGITWDTISSYLTSWRPSDIEFINPSVGFLGYGNSGYIKKTVDGGLTWTTSALYNFYATSDIEFITDSIGFITMPSTVNDVGQILKTTDQGETWVQCTSLDPSPTISNWFSPMRITYLNTDTIFVVGIGSGNWNPPGTLGIERVLRTFDGGNYWTIHGMDAINVSPSDMKIFPDGSGLMVGGSSMYRTDDFGLTWVEIDYPQPFNSVHGFILNDSIWHCSDDTGVLFSTQDAGATWIYQENEPYSRDNFLMIDEGSAFSLGSPVFKYTDELMRLKGNLFYDADQNQVRDSMEQGLANVQMALSTYSGVYFTDSDGTYEIIVDSGTHTVTPLIESFWDMTTDSASYTRTPFSIDPNSDSLNFGFYPNIFFDSLQVHLISDVIRCDDTVNVWVSISNQGTTNVAGNVNLTLADSLTFVEAVPEPDTVIGQLITWSFDSILIYQDSLFNVLVSTPDFNSIGDTLVSSVEVVDSSEQFFISDSSLDIATCAYDPNDKRVSPLGLGEEHYIGLDQELTYTIRFQNTGNATAYDVRIIDTLSTLLNVETFRYLASSATVFISIDSSGVADFFFEDIHLPDSSSNEPESHGFISFAITPNGDLLPNTEITNSAGIYFDHNPPIITNQVFSTIECYTAPPIPVVDYNHPNIESTGYDPMDFDLQWSYNGEPLVGVQYESLIPDENGVYVLELTDANGCVSASEPYDFNSLGIPDPHPTVLSINPNPATNKAQITFFENVDETWTITAVDALGRMVSVSQQRTERRIILDVEGLASGVYMLNAADNSSNYSVPVGKLVVQ